MNKWFEITKRGYLLDFQMPDSTDPVLEGKDTLLKIDPEQIVAQLKKAEVTALYTHARDYAGNCYYNTKIGHKHTGIGTRDLLAEFSRICRREGMRILFYVYMGQAHDPRGTTGAEKDFAIVGPDGKRIAGMGMCMNGPGKEYLKAILREITEQYDFDGFWLDCFGWGTWEKQICYCDICKARFRNETGCEIPLPDVRTGEAWLKYRQWMRKERLKVKSEFNSLIRSINPELTIVYNAGPKTVKRGYDTFESFDDDDYLCSEFHYQDGHGILSLQCLSSSALKRNVPFEIEIYRFFCRFNKMQRANQIRPVAQHFTEMATVLAHGGFIQYYDQILPDGTLDQRSLEMLRGAFIEVKKCEPFLPVPACAERIPYASIVWSDTCELYDAEEHYGEIEGFHFALMEKHIPYNLITTRMIREGNFGNSKVLILPSLTCMSSIEVKNIRRFVMQGGGLVATYETSLKDEKGKPRRNFLLADLFGASYCGRLENPYSFIKFNGKHMLYENLPQNWPISVFKKFQLKVKVRKSAVAHGIIVQPFRGHRLAFLPGENTPYPAAVTHIAGKGRVVYIAHPSGQCYSEFGHPDARQLIVNAVKWAAGCSPAVEVECPDTVETVMWQDKASKQKVIHLVNRTPAGPQRSKGSVITEAIPVHDIIIRLKGKVKKAVLQPEGQQLKISLSRGKAEIKVPHVNIYSIVVIDT